MWGFALQVALKFFEFFSPIYTVIFVIVRSIIGPPAVVWLSWRLVNTPGLPPIVRCHSSIDAVHDPPVVKRK